MPTQLLRRACLMAALVAPGLAAADEPTPAPPAQSLGTVETILQHCARINPAAAEQYQAQGKLLTQGASDEALAKVRQSEEYQQARDSTLESLSKIDDQAAKKACAQSLGQGK